MLGHLFFCLRPVSLGKAVKNRAQATPRHSKEVYPGDEGEIEIRDVFNG